MEIIKNNYIVTKSNDLIQASYNLTTIEQKLILIICSLISPFDSDFKMYEIRVKIIAELLEWKRKDFYKELEKITFNLLKKPLKIIEGEKKIQLNWFSVCAYEKGTVSFRFAKELKPYLLELKRNFTSYTLVNILKLKSSYSIRIYEILKKVRNSIIFSLEEFMFILGLSESYNIYANIKKRVLIPAQGELKEKTDINFIFSEIKKGNRVVKIKFIVRKNEEEDKQGMLFSSLYLELLNYLSKAQVEIIIKDYDEQYIQEKLDQLNYMIKYHPENVKGEGRFLWQSLKENWKTDQYINYKTQEKNREARKREKEKEKLENEYLQYLSAVPYDRLTKEEQTEIETLVNEIQDNKMLSPKSNEKIRNDKRKELAMTLLKRKYPFQDWLQDQLKKPG